MEVGEAEHVRLETRRHCHVVEQLQHHAPEPTAAVEDEVVHRAAHVVVEEPGQLVEGDGRLECRAVDRHRLSTALVQVDVEALDLKSLRPVGDTVLGGFLNGR